MVTTYKLLFINHAFIFLTYLSHSSPTYGCKFLGPLLWFVYSPSQKRVNFFSALTQVSGKRCSGISAVSLTPSSLLSTRRVYLPMARGRGGLWAVALHVPLCYQPKSCSFKKSWTKKALGLLRDLKWFYIYINTIQINRVEGSFKYRKSNK